MKEEDLIVKKFKMYFCDDNFLLFYKLFLYMLLPFVRFVFIYF